MQLRNICTATSSYNIEASINRRRQVVACDRAGDGKYYKEQPWEGVFDNLTHSISHLRFWEYMVQDMGLTEAESDIDECHVPTPHLTFVLDTSSFVDMHRSQQPLNCNVYTDGSKKGGKVGSGVYIVRQNQTIAQLSFRLPDEATVFQAEVLAIREAATFLSQIHDLNEIKFYVDSQAALRTFQKSTITSKLVLQTIQELAKVSATLKVFVWTKAHVGTIGNEAADQLAKAGTELPLDQTTIIPLPATSDQILLRGVRAGWNKEWANTTNCRQSKLFFKTPSTTTAKITIQWQRLKLGRFIRAITGHNNLLYHLHNMYNFISPICRFCNETNEEFYHLAYTCPALWSERQYINTLEKDHFNDWTPEQIIEFTLLPRIDQAFVKPLYWVEDERELLEVPTQSTSGPSYQQDTTSESSQTSSDLASFTSSTDTYDNTESDTDTLST